MRKSILALAVLASCFVIPIDGYCEAEETLFLNGDPQYPLIFAKEMYRHYLDLDSCAIISDDEDGFEIYAEYVKPEPFDNGHRYGRHFRKNKEGKIQVLVDDNTRWVTFWNPHDGENVNRVLDEEGKIDFRLRDYYMFKCVYQQLFGKPYEDEFDDAELRRSVIILISRKDRKNNSIPQYLWDDENYSRVWTQMDDAFYLDKSSIYIEEEDPPHYILRVLVLRTRQHHYNDILPSAIWSERIMYDEEEEKMYAWWHRDKQWHYMPPHGSNAESGMGMSVGEAAFYLTYGEKFYGAAPKWHRFFKSYWDVFQDDFYERLKGAV